jgi:putative restriction endonuclease
VQVPAESEDFNLVGARPQDSESGDGVSAGRRSIRPAQPVVPECGTGGLPGGPDQRHRDNVWVGVSHNATNMPASASITKNFEALTIWQRAGERAPHKPLLLLLALGLLSRGTTLVPYVEYEHKLADLLREFGPSRRTQHPEYPFLRLRNDGVWEVIRQHASIPGGDTIADLRKTGAAGRFPEPMRTAFDSDPRLIGRVARLLLDAHFPESLHQDILDAVGLSLGEGSSGARRRDPNFREGVLVAYQYRCALCGLDLRINNVTIGLEAAHIRWHQASGPDAIENGVALCSMHHKLFDLGAFTFEPRGRILVSERVSGTGPFEQVLLQHHGKQMSAPIRQEHHPRPEFVHWHRDEVFKEAARPN